MLRARSVNQAMNGLPPRTTPFSSASNPGWRWKTTPRRVSSSTVALMFSTWKLRMVKVAGACWCSWVCDHLRTAGQVQAQQAVLSQARRRDGRRGSRWREVHGRMSVAFGGRARAWPKRR
jgi:hypothetical protein